MEDELQGTLCQAPNNCVQVDQSLWDPDRLETIETAIDTTPGTKVVFSYSEGARSVSDWLDEYADDPDAPSPDELSFVLIANPTRAYGGSDSQVMPQTQYQVIDISRQYDTASDFPDNPFNLLALANSLAAFAFIHTDYEDVDMHDPANIVWKEGNTTYVFVPTENLPLLEPLRRLGLTGLADALNGRLKEIVERGYDRSYLPAAEEEPASTSALSVPLAADPAPRSVESKPGQQDVDRNDSGVINTVAATSASDAGDNADGEEPPTSEARETDAAGISADETAATASDAKPSTAVRTAEDSTEPTTEDKKSGGTATTGAETDDATTGAEKDDATTKDVDRDGSSSDDDRDKATASDE
ncbi:PE-PPE domain-containing protein [Mycolicibacterium hippocampi]|uniref:PE-PPE domain-containing protein n=1 Tax=Mycolicibacterium hippocampi TaxID=659824 RepID=UPI003513A602